jgi:hypothetical protein
VVKCRSVSWISNALLRRSGTEISREPFQLTQVSVRIVAGLSGFKINHIFIAGKLTASVTIEHYLLDPAR